MITKMCKVEVVGSKKRLSQTLEKIQTLGLLHVDEVPLLSPRPGKFDLHRIPLTDEQQQEKNLLEKAVDNLDEVERLMDPHSKEKAKEAISTSVIQPSFTKDLNLLVEKSVRFFKESSALHQQEQAFLDELRVLENYKVILKALAPIVSQKTEAKETRYLGLTLAKEEEKVVALIKEECGKITQKKSEISTSDIDKKNIAALISFPAKYEQKIKDFIWDQGISEIKLPSGFEKMPLADSVVAVESRIQELPKQHEKLLKEIQIYNVKNGKEILSLHHWGHGRLKRLNILEHLAQSHYTFVMMGWLPEKDLDFFKKELKNDFGEDVVMKRLVPSRRDYGKVPVQLKNKFFLKPFELLLQLFPPPTYGTMDVTFLIGLVFPFFFGFILGDIFYGLVMLGLAFYVKKKFGNKPLMKEVLTIIFTCSAWTIGFGFFYGEFLGDVGYHFGMKPLLYNREVDVLLTLGIAIGIGVVHILLAIGLAIFIASRSGDRHGFWANVAYLVCIVDILVALGALMGFLPGMLMPYALWALLVLIPWVIYLHGAMAAIEIISTLGNMLSYARLMAIGLASVVMAVIANKFVTLFGSITFGLIIAIFLHLINIALGIFAPTIQSLRLHYVEFFSKFYKPEGRKYQPFDLALKND